VSEVEGMGMKAEGKREDSLLLDGVVWHWAVPPILRSLRITLAAQMVCLLDWLAG